MKQFLKNIATIVIAALIYAEIDRRFDVSSR